MKKLLIIAILFASCSPEFHCKKCGQVQPTKVDTVYRDFFIELPAIKADSVFVSLPGDTVVIHKDRLTVKYVRLPKDSVYIEGKCDTVTLEKKVPLYVTRTIEVGMKHARVWLIAASAFLVALFVGALLSKITR